MGFYFLFYTGQLLFILGLFRTKGNVISYLSMSDSAFHLFLFGFVWVMVDG